MLAARFHASDRALKLEDVPIPEPGPLDVVVKVEACGICLSDVHLIDGSFPALTEVVTMGHESAGTVHKTGEMVQGWKPGDRVVLMAGRPCMKCTRCTQGRVDACLQLELMGFHYDGAWAEYISVPYFTLTPVPDGIDLEQAAILVDAVATPYAAITERAELKPGESIGLWGIGGLGTHAVQTARLIGAGLIVAVDPLPSARDRALKLGADVALDPLEVDVVSEVQRITGGTGLDVTLDLVGSNRVLQQCVQCLAAGGRAVIVGISMDQLELGPTILLTVQRQTIMGHLGYSKKNLDDLVKLLHSGRLDLTASISDVMPLEEVPEGVRRLSEKDGDPVRLVVKP
ncbi:MAG TPA: zinc-binding dehydrogenase [Actinomycetota bacterium]|nr:zinc-binding dehydrogenase [Actinomycetota bacterium]